MNKERFDDRKRAKSYIKTYWTDSKTHASISKIIEMRKLNKITAECLDQCVEIAREAKQREEAKKLSNGQ